MTVPPAIPFAISTVVMLWAARSGVMAFTGGKRSGLHRTAPVRSHEPDAQ